MNNEYQWGHKVIKLDQSFIAEVMAREHNDVDSTIGIRDLLDETYVTELFDKFIPKEQWEIIDKGNIWNYKFIVGASQVEVSIQNIREDEYEILFLVNDKFGKSKEFSPEETSLLFATIYQILVDFIPNHNIDKFKYTGFSEGVEGFYEKSLEMVGKKLGWEVKMIDKYSELMKKNQKVFYIINPKYEGTK